MTGAVEIRMATASDVAELARLRVAMDEEDGIHEPHGFRARFEKWYREHGHRFDVALAEVDGHAVGTLWLERVERVPRPSEPTPAPFGYVTFSFVEAGHRNKGVGAKLLSLLRNVARAQGFELLIVWPSERSVSFYSRAGFSPPPELLEHPLPTAEV